MLIGQIHIELALAMPHIETGYRLITAHLQLGCYPASMRKPVRFPARFAISEYNGWDEFHVVSRHAPGTTTFKIQKTKDGWASKDGRWAIDNVQIITREQYRQELERST